MLLKFLVRESDLFAIVIKSEGPNTRRAGIYGDNYCH